MKIDGNLKATGRLQVTINGKIERDISNLVVTVGKEWVAAMMGEAVPPSAMSHMAVGAGTTVAAIGQIALVSEIDRNALATTVTGASVQYNCTWGDGDGEGALTEAGLFNNTVGGDMLARTVFDVINKGSGDVMTIIWTITVA